MKRFVIILLFLSALSNSLIADRSRQALRAIEKGEFEKAHEFLIRSYDKDSLNPLVSFAYSQLYVSPMYDNYSLDSAHFYIKSAYSLFPNLTIDHMQEMEKTEVNLVHFDTLKVYIDSLGFERANVSHSIDGYNDFIIDYEDAAQVEEAIMIRNVLSYKEAKSENTWQSFFNFFQQYPNAIQAKEAESKYHELIYNEYARNAKTVDLEQFLISVPNSPYRDLVEQQILYDKVSGMNIDSIYAFTHRYSNDSLTQSAMGILYHWDRLELSRLPETMNVAHQIFMDSVCQIEQLNKEVLVPFYKEDTYKYHGLDGTVFLTQAFEHINSNHLCGNVTDEILEVEIMGVRQLINRKGDLLYEGRVDTYDDLGSGVIKIEKNGLFGAIHKSGFEILPIIYEEIDLLNGQLLTIKTEGLVGVAGILGKVYLFPKYDRIMQQGDFWVVEKDGLFAVSNLESILSSDHDSIDFKYEEVELLKDQYMVGYLEYTEEIIDQDLKVISPEETISAITKYDMWVFKTNEGNYLFDSKSKNIESQKYEKVLQNEEWLGLYNGLKWKVYNRNKSDAPILNIDSVKLIGRDIVVVFRNSEGVAIFPNDKLIEIEEGQFIQSLSTSKNTTAHYLVTGYQSKLRLYKDGYLMFETAYDEIGYISESVFIVKKSNKYGAVDENGRLIMRIRYDAISEAVDGVSDVLYDGKFGAYNFNDRILIDLNSEQLLERYNQLLFIQKKEGKYGLISRNNEQLVDAVFDQMIYWSDTSYLAKSNEQWSVYLLSDQSQLLSGIDSYSYLVNTDDSKIIEFQKEGHYGVYDAHDGVLFPPVYSDIYNLGTQNTPLFFAEKGFYEAKYYIAVYYNADGEMICSEAYRGREYESIVCDD